MAYLKFSTPQTNFISVPTWFITDYMPEASCGHIKVYLYLLAVSSQKDTNFTLEEVAGKLNMLYSEVITALQFWDKEEILTFKEVVTAEGETFELNFFNTKPQKVTSSPTPLPISKTTIHQTRPNYSMQELNIYKAEDQSICGLFRLAEEYLGRLLSPSDQQILFGLYDWLHMPLDMIEYLIEYCASNNHNNLRYIEKVAIAWVDAGVTTLDAAKNKTQFDKRYTKILAELGLSSQVITKVQKEFINKWLSTYQFTMDIILEACRRTVSQTKNPSLKYVDSILSSWHSSNVKLLSDISALDKAYATQNTKQTTAVPTSKPPKKNTKFTSTYSHDWDFDQLAMLEQEYIERQLNGGK